MASKLGSMLCWNFAKTNLHDHQHWLEIIHQMHAHASSDKMTAACMRAAIMKAQVQVVFGLYILNRRGASGATTGASPSRPWYPPGMYA
jgi:hypothetical protein